MIRAAAVPAVLVLVAGCGDTASPPGNAAVYQRIAHTRSCAALQREFDTAMSNAEHREPGSPQRDVSESYARAADARMRKVGCYGP